MTNIFVEVKSNTVALASLLRHMAPTVSNVPYELGLDVLREAFKEFARKTHLLGAEQFLVMQKDVADYELIPPAGYDIYSVRVVGEGDDCICGPNPDYWYFCGRRRFQVIGNNRIILGEVPTKDGEPDFRVVSTVIPNDCIDTIPTEVSIPFGKAIAQGALSEALLYKNKPWYDERLSRTMERKFHIGIQAGKNLQISNRGASSMVAKTPRWV